MYIHETCEQAVVMPTCISYRDVSTECHTAFNSIPFAYQ